jgi:hypothetical protein
MTWEGVGAPQRSAAAVVALLTRVTSNQLAMLRPGGEGPSPRAGYGTGPLRSFALVSQDAHCAGQEAMSPVAARMPVP